MRIKHEFVTTIPEPLEPGTIYVSIPYRTASHLCMCGCGNKIVTPIRPSRWDLTYDGASVSLSPSIGNWGLPCQSHYWITRDEVIWSYKMDADEIRAVKTRQQKKIDDYFKKSKKRRWFRK